MASSWESPSWASSPHLLISSRLFLNDSLSLVLTKRNLLSWISIIMFFFQAPRAGKSSLSSIKQQFASVITIFSSSHLNDPPLLLGQDNTYSLAYNQDQEINTPFAKGVRDNSGMATFASGLRNWFAQINGFVGTYV